MIKLVFSNCYGFFYRTSQRDRQTKSEISDGNLGSGFIAGLARLILRLWHSKGWSAGGSMEWRGASSIAILQVRFRLGTMFECGGWSLMDGHWRCHTLYWTLDGFIYPVTNFWLCEQVEAQWPGRIINHFNHSHQQDRYLKLNVGIWYYWKDMTGLEIVAFKMKNLPP